MQLSDDPQFFQDITILLVLATTLGALANQLGIPSILGYLLAGALVGPGGFGAINEVIEFVATLALPETNVGGYINTGWDLVANLVGATAAALIIYIGNKAQR